MLRVATFVLACVCARAEFPDLSSVPADLSVPGVQPGGPAPGRRAAMTLPKWRGTEVHHLLYLPVDWKPGRRYPVLAEYAGNGPYSNRYGDISEGTVEGSRMGYGLSGGRGFIWIALPYVNSAEKRNQRQWWGDADATAAYAVDAVREICERWGGDPSAVVLAGFSRGAIACNYIGLRNDDIADVWLAFLAYSHYDGVRRWNYPGDDPDSARERLDRLRGRAQFIIHENSVEATRAYLEQTGVKGRFTFVTLPFRNHNDGWTLRDIPARREARAWLDDVLRNRPGTYSISGAVRDRRGRGLKGVTVRTGPTHFAETGAGGRYLLRGLTAGVREVTAGGMARTVEIAAADRNTIDFIVTGEHP